MDPGGTWWIRVLFFPRNIEIEGPCGSLRVLCKSFLSQAKCTCGSLRVSVPVAQCWRCDGVDQAEWKLFH